MPIQLPLKQDSADNDRRQAGYGIERSGRDICQRSLCAIGQSIGPCVVAHGHVAGLRIKSRDDGNKPAPNIGEEERCEQPGRHPQRHEAQVLQPAALYEKGQLEVTPEPLKSSGAVLCAGLDSNPHFGHSTLNPAEVTSTLNVKTRVPPECGLRTPYTQGEVDS